MLGGNWLWVKEKGISPVEELKFVKVFFTVNQTWGLQMTGNIIFSMTLSQLSYQGCHSIYLENFRIERATLCIISTRSTNWSNPLIWCIIMCSYYYYIIHLKLTTHTLQTLNQNSFHHTNNYSTYKIFIPQSTRHSLLLPIKI